MEESKDRIFVRDFNSVRKFKSVNRAFMRGHVGIDGTIYPDRPFNNRANTSSRTGIQSRKYNEIKKSIYAGIKKRHQS